MSGTVGPGRIEKLPPEHAARTNPELKVERWKIQTIGMPPFHRVANREEVIFEGAKPQRMTAEDVSAVGVDNIRVRENAACLAALDKMAEEGTNETSGK